LLKMRIGTCLKSKKSRKIRIKELKNKELFTNEIFTRFIMKKTEKPDLKLLKIEERYNVCNRSNRCWKHSESLYLRE
jgi:hypothetical protein